MSLADMPARFSAFSEAGAAGQHDRRLRADEAKERMRARGLRPAFSPNSLEPTRIAAARRRCRRVAGMVHVIDLLDLRDSVAAPPR